MHLCDDHMQPPISGQLWFQLNVRTPTGHVRSHCHGTTLPSISNDLGLLRILNSIEHPMRDSARRQQL